MSAVRGGRARRSKERDWNKLFQSSTTVFFQCVGYLLVVTYFVLRSYVNS